MPKLNAVQNSFQSGELSPGMYGRSDTNEYQQGAKTISNFIVRPNGGLTRRPGTRYMGASKADDQTRLIPFPVGDHRYIIEMGDSFLRVWKETAGALALVPTSQEYVLPAVTSPVWGTPNAGFWELNLNRDDIPLATGMGPYAISTTGSLAATALEASSPNLYVELTTAIGASATITSVPEYDDTQTPIYLGFHTTHAFAAGMYVPPILVNSSNGTGTHTLTTQNAGFLTTTNITAGSKVRWARSDADLWIMGEVGGATYTYRIRYFEKLEAHAYVGHSDIGEGRIVIEYVNTLYRAPFHTINNLSSYGTVAGGDDENLEWTEHTSEPLNVAENRFTLAQTNLGHGGTWETGAQWNVSTGGGIVYGRERLAASTDSAGVITNWGVGLLYDPGASQDGDMIRPFTRAPTVTETDLIAFGPMFTLTEPWKALEVFQGRVCLAGGRKPGTVTFGSLLASWLWNPADSNGEITANTAFQFIIRGDQDFRINTMVATTNKLFVITRQGVYVFEPSSGTFSGATITFNTVNRTPGKDAVGVSFGDFIAYISLNGRHLMAVDVNNEGIKYNTFDLTRFSDHILEPGADIIAHQRLPESLIWAVLSDGTMASVTFDREAGIIAPASHTIAGNTVVVEDAITMPLTDTSDSIYLSVKRTVNSVVKRYIERIDEIPKYSTAIEDYVLLDCAGVYDSTAVTNVPATTFDHLNGETVNVYADGVSVGTKVIAGGVFTVALATAASKIYAGYHYNSDVNMLRPTDSFASFGTTEGSLKRNIATVTQFSNTYGGQVGADSATLEPIEYESTTPSLITGERETPIEDESKRDATLLIRANAPYPMDITAVVRRVEFESRGGE